MRYVAIIGSFQKSYEGICKFIRLLRKNGFTVTSPSLSKVVDKREGFVVFASDDNSLTNDEIQTDTLRKILNADAVYVYNDKEGYIGQTTCYEIGFLMAKARSLYYFAMPSDLPVPVDNAQIVSPEKFIEKFRELETGFILPTKDKARTSSALHSVYGGAYVLICGSMKFFDEMVEVQRQLKYIGINAIVPEDEISLPEDITSEEFNDFKRKVSRNYLDKIRRGGTQAILVLNETKNGIENYVGANTLVEIGMAFAWGRKIFIYNDFYPPLIDELSAWKSIAVKKDLSIIKKFFGTHGEDDNKIHQISFFDDGGSLW